MTHMARWIALIGLLAIGLLVILAFTVWWSPEDSSQSEPLKSSSSQTEPDGVITRQYASAKGVVIELDDWPENGVITSPMTIRGRVPGSWSHEGIFPIDILYQGDIGLPGTTAELQGDWMTEELVPFTATLTFDSHLVGDKGVIIFRNANPSGLPENDDSLGLDVQFLGRKSS